MHKAGAHVRREEAGLRDTQGRVVMEADGLMYQVTKMRKATDGSSSPVAWRETRKGPSCQDFPSGFWTQNVRENATPL